MNEGKPHPGATWGEGYIAQLGRGAYKHRFGGRDWSAEGPLEKLGAPALLVCIDLEDPVLDPLPSFDGNELPLFSYIGHDGLLQRQKYCFRLLERQARCEYVEGNADPLPPDVRLPTPLQPRSLVLRPMTAIEIPFDEESQGKAWHTSLGGDSFLRIGGPPLWIQDPQDGICDCGSECRYIASIGYEAYSRPSGYISQSDPFFIGELAMYFFWCADCKAMWVESDPT